MTPTSAEERSFAAELRAVEEGHHAYSVTDGTIYRVVSDVRPDEWKYTVRVIDGWLPGQAPTFTCDHLIVMNERHVDTRAPAGHTGCKHAALVARRLLREGYLERVGGCWQTRRHLPRPPRADQPDDPFEGL